MVSGTQQLQNPAHKKRVAATRGRYLSLADAVRIGFLASILSFAPCFQAIGQDSRPTESLSPQQVVRIVVDALKENDPLSNTGIATVFSFASPANKLSTGPLPRFTQMIKKGYADMLNHSSSRYEPMVLDSSTAIQAVWLMTPAGAEHGYAFQLSRQVDGENAGMWMTDRVIPLGKGPGSGTRI